MTVYEACDPHGKVLYDGESLADLRAKIVKASEMDYISAPDITEIRVMHNGLDFNLNDRDVAYFNESLLDLCDFSFWVDEDEERNND